MLVRLWAKEGNSFSLLVNCKLDGNQRGGPLNIIGILIELPHEPGGGGTRLLS